MFHAKNGIVKTKEFEMDYIRFGNGKKNLIMIPGLGDGLTTVKNKALPFALMYHIYSKSHTVYVFSRRNNLTQKHSTLDMAHDLSDAMKYLGLDKADIIGISQGGMIAQQLALYYPDKVNHLVLAVTSSRPNEILTGLVSYWMGLAEKDDYEKLMLDNLEKMYSDDYVRKNRWTGKLVAKFTKPNNFDRFLIQAEACLTHDVYDRLSEIKHPTLIIGGLKDQVVGIEASREIADQIRNSQLKIYEQYGHACYEEAKDFHTDILNFINRGEEYETNIE